MEFTCCICGKTITDEYGNNPWPVKEEGICCNYCNMTEVIPIRFQLLREHDNKER